MKLNFWNVFPICSILVLATAFCSFPMEFIGSGIGQGFVLTPVIWATDLTMWYWEQGIRYDCSNISLLGYRSSFSIVVPSWNNGVGENLAREVLSSRVHYVEISDYLSDHYLELIDKLALVNTRVIHDCNLEAFLSNGS